MLLKEEMMFLTKISLATKTNGTLELEETEFSCIEYYQEILGVKEVEKLIRNQKKTKVSQNLRHVSRFLRKLR